MKVGFVGAGKLGGPVALAFESIGHEVLVTDRAPWVTRAFAEKKWPHLEADVDKLLTDSRIRNVTLSELVRHSEVLFVAVQTPHEPRYGGAVPLPEDRQDFDYTALRDAINEIVEAIQRHAWDASYPPPVVAVISTVLPGTMRREIIPLLPSNYPFVYCPFFAAMGTVVRDVYHPEFTLLGHDYDDPWVEDCPVRKVTDLFLSFKNKSPVRHMSIESAELTKVCYNLWLSNKIVLANTVMEICHKIPGANCDDVMEAIKLANQRIVSTKYMTSGMGDGGGCHPRDLISMSWLGEKLSLSSNIFDEVMLAREAQAEWLVDLVIDEANKECLPVCVLGKAYKPETNLTDGSAGLLCAELLKLEGKECTHFDPYVDKGISLSCILNPAVFLIATKHPVFQSYKFPRGSVVIDPFRYIDVQQDVRVVHVGVGI